MSAVDVPARQVVMLTGAAQGIGAVSARRLARDGHTLLCCDLRHDGAEATAQAIRAAGGEALACAMDVGDEAMVAQAAALALARWGRIDTLVNGAGGHGPAFQTTHHATLADWEAILRSNLTGAFLCARAAIPIMLAQGQGHIINIASNAGRAASPLLGCSYTAAKSGVLGLTRHLATEYAAQGIRVNTLAPGPVAGERVASLIGGRMSPQDFADKIPLGLGTEEDIAGVLAFLVSPASRFMTGAIVDVNGGIVMP